MTENDEVLTEIDITSPRGRLAVRLHDVIEHRWSADVRAIGVRGSLAHGDDHDGSDVNLVVVTYRPGGGPKPVLRRVDGIAVSLDVVTGDEALRQARELTPRWPLVADGLLTTHPLLDEHGFFGTLRDTHQGRLAEARPGDFTAPARHDWEVAAAAHARAVRLAEYYETDAALVMIATARVHAALVAGLLGRTYFRNEADAVRKTGFASAGIQDLADVLAAQARDLTARGRPVDGNLSGLFD
jgi:hypothetical protein